MAMWEKVASGKIKSVWVNTTNPFQTMPDLNKYVERIKALAPRSLIRAMSPVGSRPTSRASTSDPSGRPHFIVGPHGATTWKLVNA